MTDKKERNLIPDRFREQIKAELGTMPDAKLAQKYSEISGVQISKAAIFWMRSQAGIPAFAAKPYTKPAFRGRLEDAHPEVREMFGKVPLVAIADHFDVSRSCVRAAAERCGYKPSRKLDYSDAIQATVGS